MGPGKFGIRASTLVGDRPALQALRVATLTRDGTTLAYEDAGERKPAVVLVHGLACNRAFMASQTRFLQTATEWSRSTCVVTATAMRHASATRSARWLMTSAGCASSWTSGGSVVVGHSLGGLVALELAAARPDLVRARGVDRLGAAADGDRRKPSRVSSRVFAARKPTGPARLLPPFFGPHDDPALCDWILDEAVHTPTHVTSSIWEESCDAGTTPGAGALPSAAAVPRRRDPQRRSRAGGCANPSMALGRTVGTGHFSRSGLPEQVNAMLERFLAVGL